MRKAAKNIPIIRRMIKIEENEIKSARRMRKGARKSHLMIAGGETESRPRLDCIIGRFITALLKLIIYSAV
jgi:hypothetical protein